MRKLLKTILHAPTFTTNEIDAIFTAKEVMTAKSTFAHALLANDAVTGRKISSAFVVTAAIFDDIQQFDKDLKAAWHTVQQQKTKKKDRNEFAADDALPIAIEVMPDGFSVAELKKIKDYLEALHYALQPLIAEQSLKDNAYGSFDYVIAQIESAVTTKLPRELQGYPIDNNEDEVMQEPLVAPTLSADVTATVALLKNQDEAERLAINEEKIIKTAKIQKAKISELLEAYAQQREMALAYQFNKEFKQYKSVLSSYIKETLEYNDISLYLSCFNQPAYVERSVLGMQPAKADPIAKITDVINKNDDQIVDEHELKIKQFAKENLNFSRAVANYKLIHDAQTKLHPQNPEENKPEHLVERLKNLYQEHADIDQKLQQVGNEAVDKATSGIRGFFKKIFSSINWYFSAAGRKEREFKAFAKKNRERFFTVTQTQPPVTVEQNAQPEPSQLLTTAAPTA